MSTASSRFQSVREEYLYRLEEIRFEPWILSRLCGLSVRVRVVPRRTVVGDIDRRFDNLSGSHHQSKLCIVRLWYLYLRNSGLILIASQRGRSNQTNKHEYVSSSSVFVGYIKIYSSETTVFDSFYVGLFTLFTL